MASPHVIPVGTSEAQDFAIVNAGAALDLTSLIPELEIVDADGIAVTGLTVSALVASEGTVRVTGTEVLVVGTYRVRFKLTDGAGKVGFAPNGENPMVWAVESIT